jgi:hypothetical protein
MLLMLSQFTMRVRDCIDALRHLSSFGPRQQQALLQSGNQWRMYFVIVRWKIVTNGVDPKMLKIINL